MAINDVFEVQFQMISDDRIVQISHYYVETLISSGTQAEVTKQMAEAAEVDFWTDFWQTFASDDLVYHQTKCQQIYPTRQVPYISPILATETGSVPTTAMNGTTATLVSLYGQKWDAAFRGRTYIPGLPESKADKGRIASVSHALIQTAAATFFEITLVLAAPAGGQYSAAVVSPTKMKAVDDPVWDFIDTVIVRPRIATQRRRRTLIQTPS